MLNTFEIVLYACCVPLLLMALVALAKGSLVPPQGSPLAKYHRAERYLGVSGNLYMVALCGSGLSRLAAHFGLLAPHIATKVSLLMGIAFGVGLVTYLTLWARAILRVRRSGA